MGKTLPPIADPQLWLLQLSDSALPIGSYSHSWGLETAVQADRLQSATQVAEYLTGLLHQAIGPQEGAACVLAHRYSCDADSAGFLDLQLELTAARWATEPLNASLQLGNRLNRWARSTWELSCPDADSIHHCAAFGWLCAQAGLTATETVRAYLLGSLTSLVSAAVRLVPLGHSQGQQVLATLHGEIAIAIPTCLAVESPDSLHSFAPVLERDCQAHRTLYSRLFQS
ncbi:MAG: urease accessory UreF family protein [Cyanobacteria bacterium J06597_1]